MRHNVYRKHARMQADSIAIDNLCEVKTYKSALFVLFVGGAVVIVDDNSLVKNEESLLDAAHASLSPDLEHHAFMNGRLRGEYG